MDKGRIIGAIMLLAVTAGAIGYTASRQAAEQAEEEAAYQALLDAAPAAEVVGEPVSPNGRFEVRTVGESDLWISGVRIPEALQIVDTETGEVVRTPGTSASPPCGPRGTTWWPSPAGQGRGGRSAW